MKRLFAAMIAALALTIAAAPTTATAGPLKNALAKKADSKPGLLGKRSKLGKRAKGQQDVPAAASAKTPTPAPVPTPAATQPMTDDLSRPRPNP